MNVVWKKTQYPNIRFFEHATRKFKTNPDKKYYIRLSFKDPLTGKRIRTEEPVGWSHEGWNLQKVVVVLGELVQNQILGQRPFTLAEKRAMAAEGEQATAFDNTTFEDFWHNQYLPTTASKAKNTILTEKGLYKNWYTPELIEMRMKDITALNVKAIESEMRKQGRANRTIQYARQLIHQIFELAIEQGLVAKNPAHRRRVKRPKSETVDNQRTGYLTRTEAANLMSALIKRARVACINFFGTDQLMKTENYWWDTHDMALLSLNTGFRAGEVFGLRWDCVNLSRSLITAKATKSGKDRTVPLSGAATEMFKRRLNKMKDSPSPGSLVFPAKGTTDKIRKMISKAYPRTITALEEKGLDNGGIRPRRDKREKITFHSLRHTYASWLIMEDVSIYVVKELLGHSTIKMTERYSHLAPDHRHDAILKVFG